MEGFSAKRPHIPLSLSPRAAAGPPRTSPRPPDGRPSPPPLFGRTPCAGTSRSRRNRRRACALAAAASARLRCCSQVARDEARPTRPRGISERGGARPVQPGTVTSQWSHIQDFLNRFFHLKKC